MKILIWGTYRENYSRNQLIIDGLRKVGIEVIECQETLWKGERDRVNIAHGNWMLPSFWIRVIKSYYKLIIRFLSIKEFDILYVAYPGHFDIYVAKILSIFKKKPLVWDVLNSLYLIMSERKINQNIIEKVSITIIKFIEMIACKLPDMMFLDNHKFVNWFCDLYKLDISKFKLIPIGADSRYFYPIHKNPKLENLKKVIYYGTYIPNHGVQIILDAALKLRNFTNIKFLMVGDGPEKEKSVQFVNEKKLDYVDFIGWLNREDLLIQIANSDIVLGVFGNTMQLSLTNNNKIFEAFAMKKPVISSFSEALPQEIRHGFHLHLCNSGDAVDLAESIKFMIENPDYCNKLSENGYLIYKNNFDNFQIGKKTKMHLESLI